MHTWLTWGLVVIQQGQEGYRRWQPSLGEQLGDLWRDAEPLLAFMGLMFCLGLAALVIYLVVTYRAPSTDAGALRPKPVTVTISAEGLEQIQEQLHDIRRHVAQLEELAEQQRRDPPSAG